MGIDTSIHDLLHLSGQAKLQAAENEGYQSTLYKRIG
jgi:hypothetical protein